MIHTEKSNLLKQIRFSEICVQGTLWWEDTTMRGHSDQGTLRWEDTAMRGHCDERTLRWEVPDQGTRWWDDTLIRGHCDEGTLRWEDTAIRGHCDEGTLWWEDSLIRGHCDERTLWSGDTAMRGHPVIRGHCDKRTDQRLVPQTIISYIEWYIDRTFRIWAIFVRFRTDIWGGGGEDLDQLLRNLGRTLWWILWDLGTIYRVRNNAVK